MDAGFVALGLVQGALAGLNALGLTLLWRTTRVVNLAQSAIGLVGGVLTGMLVSASGWGFWWAAPVGVGVGAFLGFASERIVLVRLATLPRTVPMVATIGLAALFVGVQSGIPFFFGGRLPAYDVDVGIEVFVFPVLLKGPHLLALASLPLALAGLWWFAHRTRIGTAALAAGQDLERAQAVGVPAGFVRAISWTIAGTLSGIAGVLSVPVLGFSLGDGVPATVVLLSLAPAVLAGMRSLPATALASLAVGVAYQYALIESATAGAADVLLAAAIVVALAVRGRPLERAARLVRSSSWASAVAPPPLPRVLRTDRRWRRVTAIAAGVVVLAAAIPPLSLPPSADVRYGTGAAFVIAAVAVAAAWIFAGEMALGHWGIAALGATAASVAPGPVLVRALLGVVVGAVVGSGLGAVARRRGGLAGAVAGLAVAVAAPHWLLLAGSAPLDLDAQTAAVLAGAAAAASAVAVTWLRGRSIGVGWVAARDDPRRAADLGVSAVAAATGAMGLSGALAGLAGVAYLAAVPAGIAPNAFEAARSFDVVAFAVVGGLGSAVGAAAGAATLLTADVVLPAPWGSLATGAGVVWVVLFAPGGVGRALARIRDVVASILRSDAFPDPPRPAAVDAVVDAPDGDDDGVAIVAGADTREATASPTVRAAATAAFLLAAPVAASLFGAPQAVADHLGADPGRFGPWLVLLVGAIAAGVAVHRWRTWKASSTASSDVLVTGGMAAALPAFVMTGDEQLVTLLALATPVAGGFVLAGSARLAASATVPRVRSAAAGVVTAAATAGLLGAAHLAAVASGNGLLGSARWASLYATAATLALVAAHRRAGADRLQAAERAAAVPAAAGRRRWAPLRVESLTVDLGGHRILHQVDLEIGSRELVALVGGNGTGKSTLLRAVAGLVPVVAGRIDVAGEEVTALRPDERSGSGVAFVSGASPVFPDLTVRENLRVGGYLTHRPARSFRAACADVLTIVPVLADRLDTRAGLLSGGEQRQLALAQTLFRRPVLLLADELALGLDVEAQATVLRLLRMLANDGVGVVVVDHDVDSLTRMADRVLVARHGTVQAIDDADEFARLRQDLVPARFLAGASP